MMFIWTNQWGSLKKEMNTWCVNLSKFIILLLYVDNILLATNDLGLLSETKKFLSNNFEMKDMSETYYVMGIEIFHDHKNC